MGAGHGHRLHFHGHSPVHRAPAHLKLLALVGLHAARGRHAALLVPRCSASTGVLLRRRRRSPGSRSTYLAKRMVIELPFVLFAVLVPFVATGPQTEVLGVSVSEPGLLAAWGLLVKGTLGVLASLTLAATTEPQDVLAWPRSGCGCPT